jgi:hypothetical protein
MHGQDQVIQKLLEFGSADFLARNRNRTLMQRFGRSGYDFEDFGHGTEQKLGVRS